MSKSTKYGEGGAGSNCLNKRQETDGGDQGNNLGGRNENCEFEVDGEGGEGRVEGK